MRFGSLFCYSPTPAGDGMVGNSIGPTSRSKGHQNLGRGDGVKRRRLLALSLGVVLVTAACSGAALTVDDIGSRSVYNNDELITWLDCDGEWYSTADAIGPPSIDWNTEKVVDTTKEVMGLGGPVAADARRAGNVWALIDEAGQIFGGLEAGRDILWCSSG